MSQPGLIDGAVAQRANLTGFCTEAVANAIQAGLLATDLLVFALPAAIAGDSMLQVPITRVGMSKHTWAGAHEDVDEWRDELADEAVAVISASWTIEVIDLVWGRNDVLWSSVLAALRTRPQRHVATYLADTWSPSEGLVFIDE